MGLIMITVSLNMAMCVRERERRCTASHKKIDGFIACSTYVQNARFYGGFGGGGDTHGWEHIPRLVVAEEGGLLIAEHS